MRRLLKMGGTVGAWDTGPFDNDTAADWCLCAVNLDHRGCRI
jgi:hypothetical protein